VEVAGEDPEEEGCELDELEGLDPDGLEGEAKARNGFLNSLILS